MRRFRRQRRRRAALALFPALAILGTTIAIGPAISAGAGSTAARFDSNKQGKVSPGTKVKLRGVFPPAPQPAAAPVDGSPADPAQSSASRQVRIESRVAGSPHWRKAKLTQTDGKGRYNQRVKVKRTTRFRAVHADGRSSKPERIRVKSKLRSKLGDKNVKLGQKVPVKGQVLPRGSRRKVVVRIGGDKLQTRTRRNGKFKLKWRADKVGSVKASVRAKSDKFAAGSKDKAGKATVYRPAQASWYGPGFYGNRTACGQTLTTSTMGVAHKTMPCGTKLKLSYGNRTVKVEVIDRGPYAGDREFDLTSATKQKLGFPSTGVVYASR